LRAAQLNPVDDQFPELGELAPCPPTTVAIVVGTYSSKIVPFANEIQRYAISTEDSFDGSQGNAAAVAVKNVTVNDSRESCAETASKYHQSNTDELRILS
jgi:tartrate dehydratase alpha subunit/fumarate hydratase class I-like protein